MENENNREKGWLRKILSRLWGWWSSTGMHKYLSSDTLEKPRHSGSLLAGIHAYRPVVVDSMDPGLRRDDALWNYFY